MINYIEVTIRIACDESECEATVSDSWQLPRDVEAALLGAASRGLTPMAAAINLLRLAEGDGGE